MDGAHLFPFSSGRESCSFLPWPGGGWPDLGLVDQNSILCVCWSEKQREASNRYKLCAAREQWLTISSSSLGFLASDRAEQPFPTNILPHIPTHSSEGPSLVLMQKWPASLKQEVAKWWVPGPTCYIGSQWQAARRVATCTAPLKPRKTRACPFHHLTGHW